MKQKSNPAHTAHHAQRVLGVEVEFKKYSFFFKKLALLTQRFLIIKLIFIVKCLDEWTRNHLKWSEWSWHKVPVWELVGWIMLCIFFFFFVYIDTLKKRRTLDKLCKENINLVFFFDFIVAVLFDNFLYCWFVFVFFNFFKFILAVSIGDVLNLVHFFNKNQLKVSSYFYYLDYWSILSKKFLFNLIF